MENGRETVWKIPCEDCQAIYDGGWEHSGQALQTQRHIISNFGTTQTIHLKVCEGFSPSGSPVVEEFNVTFAQLGPDRQAGTTVLR